MKLQSHHHAIFRAMKPNREYTATDILNRADLPRGFNVRDVAEGLKLLRKIGAVEAERLPSNDISLVYRRVEQQPQ